MSTTERREVHTTRVVRTLSPQRTLSNQNLSEFDNNLDNLLDDLQNSVSRPGSSLGNTSTYRETRSTAYGTGKSDSLSRVQHLTAANPTTVIADESFTTYKTQPGETVKTIKTYKENYSSYNVNSGISPEKSRMQSNINKLDTLLDDLQQARQGTLEKGISDAGIDPGLLEPVVETNKKVLSKKSVHRELVYDSDSQRNKRAGSIEREIIVNDGTYGDIRQIRQQSPVRNTSTQNAEVRSYNYKSETRNAVSPTEITESTNPDINPNILAQLDPNLLPPPNTKVTTTIKTYTYEIPGSGYPSTVSPKLSDTVYSSNPSTPSQSFAYNKIENTSTNLSTNYPGNYVRPVSPNPSGYSSKHVENITTTTKNVTNDGFPPVGYNTTPLSNKKTYVYNETTTTRNVNQLNPLSNEKSPINPIILYPSDDPRNPNTTHHTYIINESNTTRNVTYPRNGYPPNQNYPPDHPNHTTIIYKNDSSTTHNYVPNQPYPDNYSPKRVPPYGGKPHDREPRDVNITYKYSSHTTSENEPLLQPMPFPTDPNEIDGPPKKLDQLLAEIGTEPPNNAYNAGFNAKQAELAQQKEVERISEVNKKVDVKTLPKSKNIAGPPVYYPPGHEMFSHKEESGGYRAEGGMMKESGKYKYEAKSGSKSKSSSGVAVVPVCLPLCCGLPCVIM